MDKSTFIATYTDIETKWVVRKVKNEKLEALFVVLKDSCTDFTAREIIDITRELLKKEVPIRFPLFKHLLYPKLSEQAERNNVEAIKLLIRLDQLLINYQGYTKEYKYSSLSLILKGLDVAPDDTELLQAYEQDQRAYFLHTLHELPSGVLYEMDGASIEECEELLSILVDYEKVCTKLHLDRSKLIQECRLYYAAYKDYQINRKNYTSFKEHLELEQIPFTITNHKSSWNVLK